MDLLGDSQLGTIQMIQMSSMSIKRPMENMCFMPHIFLSSNLCVCPGRIFLGIFRNGWPRPKQVKMEFDACLTLIDWLTDWCWTTFFLSFFLSFLSSLPLQKNIHPFSHKCCFFTFMYCTFCCPKKHVSPPPKKHQGPCWSACTNQVARPRSPTRRPSRGLPVNYVAKWECNTREGKVTGIPTAPPQKWSRGSWSNGRYSGWNL